MVEYRGVPIEQDGLAWIELLIAVGIASAFLLLLRLLTGRRTSLSEAMTGGFLVWFGSYMIAFAAAACVVPAYLISGLTLIAIAVVTDEPVREFVRGSFYFAFAPAYVATIGIAAFYFFGDELKARFAGGAPSPEHGGPDEPPKSAMAGPARAPGSAAPPRPLPSFKPMLDPLQRRLKALERKCDLIERRMVELLKEEDDPEAAMMDAASRLLEASVLDIVPIGMSMHEFAGTVMEHPNIQEHMSEIAPDVEPLRRFETFQELVTFLLPHSESLD